MGHIWDVYYAGRVMDSRVPDRYLDTVRDEDAVAVRITGEQRHLIAGPDLGEWYEVTAEEAGEQISRLIHG